MPGVLRAALVAVFSVLIIGQSYVNADTYPRQASVDVIHYTFRLALNDANDEIQGETTVDIKACAVLSEVILDLASASDGRGMSVSGVTSGGSAVRFVHSADRLKIVLAEPLNGGETRSFTVAYRGVPKSGLRIGKNKHGNRTFFSDNWPDKARLWLPVIDHPYDKATSELIVTAPSRYQVVSNGLLQEESDVGEGLRLTHWKQSVPIATWLTALGVAPFASHHAGTVRGIPLQSWVYPQERATLFKALEDPAKRAIELFSDRVGPFPYEKLAGVEAAGVDGGMELAGAIFYGERSLSGARVPQLVAHEIAHQWFGDSITESDWNDVWLSEGFATYFAMIYAEHYEGPGAFIGELKRAREVALAATRRSPDAPIIHRNLSDTRKLLSPLVYQKAGWVLHMLRQEVGEEAFWAGIRSYYTRHRDGNVTTEDFRKDMESASKTDLAPFFDQWLKRPGVPKVDGGWTYDPTSKQIKVDLAQSQTGGPYNLAIEIGVQITEEDSSTITKFRWNEVSKAVEIAADQEPFAVKLDPGMRVLMDSKFQKR